MSRPSWQLRDAALGYASRGIPVLPLHYPLPHRHHLQPVGGDQPLPGPAVGAACSCRDPGCGQVGKHPLGSLGVKDATTNRARVLAWWTQQPQANIGLACGHRFDVLDIDGAAGAQAIRSFASEHDLQSSGPLVRTGGGGWHFYLAPTGLGNVHPDGLQGWTGAAAAAMWSPHPAGIARAAPTSGSPVATWTRRWAKVPAPLLERLHRPPDRQASAVVPLPVGDRPGPGYGKAALAQELARVATAPHGQRNLQLWEATRNLYNLVAAGALDHRQVHQGLLQAAERCGLLAEEPRQTTTPLPRPPGRPGSPPPGPSWHPPRPHPCFATPAGPGGRRTNPGGEVTAMAAAGQQTG